MIWLFALLATCANLFAQSEFLQEADSLFGAANYERVELIVLRAERQTGISDSERVALELLGGYSLIMLNREIEARHHFELALEADSTLTLDPVEISPKFRVVFDDVRNEWLSRKLQGKPDQQEIQGAHFVGASSESHVMNLLVPGSGFIREGKAARGFAHLIVQAAAAGLWLSEMSQTSDARKKYLAASTTEQAVQFYDNYDSHHRLMWTYGLSSFGIYLISQLDLALFRKTESLELIPTSTGARLSLHL